MLSQVHNYLVNAEPYNFSSISMAICPFHLYYKFVPIASRAINKNITMKCKPPNAEDRNKALINYPPLVNNYC